MKKAIFSLLLMAASVIGVSAQGSATTAQNPQDVDVLYAKNLLAVGTEAPAFPALKKGTWTVLDFWATWCPDCRREFLPSRRCSRVQAPVPSSSVYPWIPTSRNSTTTLRQTAWNGSSTASSRSGRKLRFPRITRFPGFLPCIFINAGRQGSLYHRTRRAYGKETGRIYSEK